MSDRNAGLFSALASGISDEAMEHRRASPIVQHDNSAFFGGCITGTLGYAGVKLGPYADQFSLGWKIAAVAAFCYGLMLLRLGWAGTRGKPRNPIGAVASIAFPAFGYYVVTNYLPGLIDLFWFRAASAGVITAYAVRFMLDVRSPGSGAFDMVTEDIDRNEWRW
jgi:hypothetical protein